MKEVLDFVNFDFHLPVTDPTWIFFLVLVIILFAPIVLERLRIPHIIGMILAGVVIGEHGFNILARDSSFELFGKVGLYYIMFLAGLEMNMEDFKSIRVKATVLGLLAFIFPLGIGIWTNLHLLGYSLATSVLLASMYASHTLIAYPIVIRYGINRQRAVSIAVGGTAVTDTLTLLVLAVVGGMYKGETSEMFWIWLVLKVVVLSVVIMYAFPRIGRWFFRRYSDNVVQYIFVMAMVFLGAGQQSRIHCTRLAGNKADIWYLRQHPKVLNLPWVEKIRRADRDNTIDVYISDEHDDVLANGVWQQFFTEKPEVLTREEKRAWLDTLKGVVLGSDAFFPFGDNIERAHKSGVEYIAQAGGSVRDDHVIATCDKYGIAMAFTGIRLFHH